VTPLRVIRVVVIVLCAAGITGMIVASVAGNNNGVVITIGGFIVLAAIVLMTVNTVTVHERIDAFETEQRLRSQQRPSERSVGDHVLRYDEAPGEAREE